MKQRSQTRNQRSHGAGLPNRCQRRSRLIRNWVAVSITQGHRIDGSILTRKLMGQCFASSQPRQRAEVRKSLSRHFELAISITHRRELLLLKDNLPAVGVIGTVGCNVFKRIIAPLPCLLKSGKAALAIQIIWQKKSGSNFPEHV